MKIYCTLHINNEIRPLAFQGNQEFKPSNDYSTLCISLGGINSRWHPTWIVKSYYYEINLALVEPPKRHLIVHYVRSYSLVWFPLAQLMLMNHLQFYFSVVCVVFGCCHLGMKHFVAWQ